MVDQRPKYVLYDPYQQKIRRAILCSKNQTFIASMLTIIDRSFKLAVKKAHLNFYVYPLKKQTANNQIITI